MSVDFTPDTGHVDAGDGVSYKGQAGRASVAPETGSARAARRPGLSRLALIVFCLLAVGGVGAAGFFFLLPRKNDGGAKPAPVMTVTVQAAEYRNVLKRVSVNGSISAWDPISIGSEVNGLRIDEVLVDEGQHVKRGQVLITLNSSILKAQLDQQRAHLQASQADLNKAIQPNRIEDLNSWRAAVAQARAAIAQEEAGLLRAKSNYANAQENARRYADLRKQGAVSQMETDNALNTARVMQAEVTNAEKHVEAARYSARQSEEHLSMALSGGRKEDILASRADVAENKARIRQLEAQIAQTVIRAPDDGLIVKRDAHLGEITAVGKQLFQMVRENRLELRAQVPETDLSAIRPGQKVTLTAGAEGGERTKGVVREISPLVDQATRLGTVRIDVPSDPHILPGMFFSADIEVGNVKALTVPARAVLSREDQSFVFLLAGDRAQSRSVKTGERVGDEVEIVSGLRAGDQVIVSGAGFLRDDDLVKVVR